MNGCALPESGQAWGLLPDFAAKGPSCRGILFVTVLPSSIMLPTVAGLGES